MKRNIFLAVTCKLLLPTICFSSHLSQIEYFADTGLVPDLQKIIISYLDEWESQQLEHIGRGAVRQLNYSADGHYFAVVTQYGISLFDAHKNYLKLKDFPCENGLTCAAFVPAHNLLVFSSKDRLKYINLTNLEIVRDIHLPEVAALTYTPNGSHFIYSSIKSGVYVCPVDKTGLALIAHATTLTSDNQKNNGVLDHIEIKGWNTGYKIAHHDAVLLLACSPDSRYLASCAMDNKKIVVSNIASATQHILENPARITSLQFSADSKWLVSADSTKMVRVWEPFEENRRDPCVIPQFFLTSPVKINKVACSPNGTYIAGAGDNCQIVIWNAKTHKLRTSCTHEPDDYQVALTFSPDGTYLAVGLSRKSVTILTNQAFSL